MSQSTSDTIESHDDLGWMVEYIHPKRNKARPQWHFCEDETEAGQFARDMRNIGWEVELWAL